MELIKELGLGFVVIVLSVMALYIVFKIAIQLLGFMFQLFVGGLCLLLICIGIVIIGNFARYGTFFGNGVGFSDGIHQIVTDEKPKDSVKEFKPPHEIEAPHQIEGVKEIK